MSHPDVRLRIHEHEPFEALALLARDEVDLALTYDYNLSPVVADSGLDVTPLWSADWGLGVPKSPPSPDGEAAAAFDHYRDHDWIVNSRNTADEEVVRTLASMAGFAPRVTHRVDSLELVQELIQADLGVGLLPIDHPTTPPVVVLPLHSPTVTLRAFSVVRRGRSQWPPLALVLDALKPAAGEPARYSDGPPR